jgi:CMP-N-acetylneuraminic acid synthetase
MVAAGASVIGLIPARAGSRRVQNKNIRRLGAHPLIAYTIAAARASGVLDAVLVSTDSERIADVARHYGAEVPFLRPEAMATETSPDIEWLRYTLERLRERGREYQAFSILRPTSPFRKPQTIRRAWRQFLDDPAADSLRAIEKCAQHPGKMWVVSGNRMTPFVKEQPEGTPWHSRPYQALPPVYAQNASLEIAWTRVVTDLGTISGDVLMPFISEGDEGFDINVQEEWWIAERMLETGAGTLPEVEQDPYPQPEPGK